MGVVLYSQKIPSREKRNNEWIWFKLTEDTGFLQIVPTIV